MFFYRLFRFQAVSRAEVAEKSLQAAEREGRRIREQNETMLAELQVGADRSIASCKPAGSPLEGIAAWAGRLGDKNAFSTRKTYSALHLHE